MGEESRGLGGTGVGEGEDSPRRSGQNMGRRGTPERTSGGGSRKPGQDWGSGEDFRVTTPNAGQDTKKPGCSRIAGYMKKWRSRCVEQSASSFKNCLCNYHEIPKSTSG